MITIPMWLFILFCICALICLMAFLGCLIDGVIEKLKEYIIWKTKYDEYKDFWDRHSELR